MPDLVGQVGELRLKLQITRKETGLTEEVEMVGAVDAEALKALQDAGFVAKENSNESGSQ